MDLARPTGGELHGTGFRLSWGECDPAGIIYYAAYLEWAERVHSEWWYLQGIHLARMADEHGAAFVVRHVACDYHRSPAAMDLLHCSMSVERIGDTSFTMAFRFTAAASGAEQAVLHLTAVFIDDDRRPVSMPVAARALLEGTASRDEETR